MKKILLSLGAATAVLVGASMFAAFEAHVVNVTARIENALFVPVVQSGIDFGTVFPQEKLEKFFDVQLSQSFQDEDRVDDVTYVIRQKPKCQLTEINGTELPEFGVVTEDEQGNFVCADEEHYDMLPLLCPYLSKHEQTTDGTAGENDSAGIAAFHGLPLPWTLNTTLATQVAGKLIKSAGDLLDTWNIDLKVPCFGNHCAQDWADFVAQNGGTENNANPNDYIQPEENEHKLFGCDLWLEVTGISLPGLGCQDELDMMLVLDRSGSIDSDELASLKTAANAFVTALAPSGPGVHIGQSSFSTTGTLDLHLTGVEADVHTAINALATGGFTNLKEGIELATGELADAHEHERAAVPDVMVVITDGNPNRPNDDVTADKAAAAAAADAARSAGIKVFVVGVGNDLDATFLQTEIADDANHYFAATDYASLQAVLTQLTVCDEEQEQEVVVNANNTDWWFFNEVATGSGAYVAGPATPPAGSGSAQLTVDDTGRELFGTFLYAGTKLADLGRLEYSTYRDVGTSALAPSLQLDIDNDVTDLDTGWKGRLVYEPYYTYTVQDDTWQAWNTLDNAAAGNWWFSSWAPGQAVCSIADPCTWTEVLTAFPDIGIRSAGPLTGALQFKAGGPWTGGFTGSVDKFRIKDVSTEKMYNFEL